MSCPSLFFAFPSLDTAFGLVKSLPAAATTVKSETESRAAPPLNMNPDESGLWHQIDSDKVIIRDQLNRTDWTLSWVPAGCDPTRCATL
jgi:hypothetical protein